MEMHESITEERVLELVKESMFGMSNYGICIKCGEEEIGVEPDAEGFRCEGCGEFGLYGAEQLMLYMVA